MAAGTFVCHQHLMRLSAAFPAARHRGFTPPSGVGKEAVISLSGRHGPYTIPAKCFPASS